MKKISLYIMALLTMGMFGCSSDDFEATTKPQSNPQESILVAGDVEFESANIQSLNLAELIKEDKPITVGTVIVKEGVMPNDVKLKAIVEIDTASTYSSSKSIESESLDGTNEVRILPSKLQEAYVTYTRDPKTTTIHMRTFLYTMTGEESMAYAFDPNTVRSYSVAFTPVDEVGVSISNVYYTLIEKADGSGYTEQKCSHSKKNVYDDPEFKVTFDAHRDENGARLDTKYAFVAEEDLPAFRNGDMSVVIGDGGNNKLVKGGQFFTGIADDDADKYKITLNMEFMTILVDSDVSFFCYYLYINSEKSMKIDAPETSENYMFYKVDATTFSYTTEWPTEADGKNYFVKIWERNDMNANTIGNAWGDSKTLKESGSLKQGGTWLGPLTEGWYTLTIKMDEKKDKHNYEWSSVTAPTTNYTSISIIGNFNGTSWDNDVDLTECVKARHNWCLLGYEVKSDDGSDVELKFRANHAWSNNNGAEWGGDGSQHITQAVYTLPAGTENIKVPVGTYNFYLNDITGQWSILKVAAETEE